MFLNYAPTIHYVKQNVAAYPNTKSVTGNPAAGKWAQEKPALLGAFTFWSAA